MKRLALLSLPILLVAQGRALAQTLPVAEAGGDQTVECAGPRGAGIQLNGAASSDADGQPLTFTWTSPSFRAGPLTGSAPLVLLPLGTHVITLEVADGVDGTDSDEVVVTVQDTTPPLLRVGGIPLTLWPPNHTLHDVAIERFVFAATDACDAELDRDDARFGRVTSDEPENGTGDGDTGNDIVIGDECRELQVRAERKGNGDGRVYRAEFAVEDASGNVASRTIEVARVFKAPPKGAVDSGEAYGVTSDCAPDGPGLCPPLPDPSCTGLQPRGRAYVLLFANPRSSRFDGLRFYMAGIDSSADDFGDPRESTEYQLCVYGREDDEEAEFGLLMNPRASAGPAWVAGRDSFLYRMRFGRDDGLNLVALRAVPGGRGSITVIGSGDDLEVPDLPLDEDLGVDVQLHNSDGQCWSAEFPDALRNSPVLFQAIDY
jgi:hypothetical protein